VAGLRKLALNAAHPGSRERFLALHEIAQGRCATAVAARTGRRAQTVMGWLHAYNEHGVEALRYQRTGGPPRFRPDIAAALGDQVRAAQRQTASPPLAGRAVKPLWTLRHLVGFVRAQFSRHYCRETIRRVLHRLELSCKKTRKLLGRTKPEQRVAFIDRIGSLLDGVRDERHHLVYLDEAHVHQDVDLGYGWDERGKRFHVASSSPGLADKVSFYGPYLYNEGARCGSGRMSGPMARARSMSCTGCAPRSQRAT
jgi:transposase